MPNHYEVEGPCRDYDSALFCEEHNNEATDFAGAWLAEVFDNAEVGESVSVSMRVVAGEIPYDCECSHCGKSPNNDKEV